ncbi:hypothetical protein GGH94_001535 [Coemansia aciculifera]|uniref:Uncharacterized protein n=1 Tax=Coemansia aciculifera TaxID=417176 RepID=A0A9W8M4V1_9FUNG|nr:hypothetical protein GGH94_001535 [Coemansia aciculifera]
MSVPTSPTGISSVPQVSDLFDFPIPPTEFPELILRPVQAADAMCNRYTSAASIDLPLSPDVDVDSHNTPQRSVGILLQNFKRISKSTTSLPNISGHGTDAFGYSEYSLAGEAASTELKPFTHTRAAKSHHNLLQTEESPLLSQSLFSMNSRCEPMSDVADLLTPIESRSYEFDMGKSTGTITLVSHTHAPSTTSSVGQQIHRHPGPAGNSAGLSREVHYQIPTPMPRKQASMSQIGNRQSNRNSMFIAGSLLPAIDMDESEELHNRQSEQPNLCITSLGSRASNSALRTSRYLYDVPTSAPSGGVQGTLSKAFSWSQRIGQGSSKRPNRTSSLAIDQHKIYDIYEESIWHSSSHISHTAPEPAASPFELDTDSAQSHDISEEESRRQKSNVGDGSAGSRLKSLHSMASSGAPWRMLRSIKLGTSSRDNTTECDGSSTFTGSVYSDSSSESNVPPPDMKRPASQPVLSKVARKPSVLHTLVKRAGLGLVRRSVSFCKLVSGARLVSGNADSCEEAPGSYDCNSSTISSSSSSSASIASSKHNKKPRRVLDAMRQAKNRLLKSLKPAGRHWQTTVSGAGAGDDDRDVVSAYPTDSTPGTELDSYLSLSAIHSPEGHMLAIQDGSSSDTHVASTSGSSFGAGSGIASKYVPPKCPSYLGLHRRVVANVQRCDIALPPTTDQASIASNPFRQAPPPAALAAPAARLRPTQFKSPFTTLPYGAYSQIHQVQAQHR